MKEIKVPGITCYNQVPLDNLYESLDYDDNKSTEDNINNIIENNNKKWTLDMLNKLGLNAVLNGDALDTITLSIPDNWSILPIDKCNKMILDDKGRRRLDIYYKDPLFKFKLRNRATYNHIEFKTRYFIENPKRHIIEVYDGKTFMVRITDNNFIFSRKALNRALYNITTMLNNKYPKWQSLDAYWD